MTSDDDRASYRWLLASLRVGKCVLIRIYSTTDLSSEDYSSISCIMFGVALSMQMTLNRGLHISSAFGSSRSSFTVNVLNSIVLYSVGECPSWSVEHFRIGLDPSSWNASCECFSCNHSIVIADNHISHRKGLHPSLQLLDSQLELVTSSESLGISFVL